jgi:hypothetical protein
MGESWGDVRESLRANVESADRMCSLRSAAVARRYWADVSVPSSREILTVAMETWRRLADVGRVETMVGAEGAAMVSVSHRLVGTLSFRP